MNSTKTKKKGSKRKSRKLAPLTDKALQAVGPKAKRYTLRDGRGLFLDVTPAGVRTWIFRYQFKASKRSSSSAVTLNSVSKQPEENVTNSQSKFQKERRLRRKRRKSVKKRPREAPRIRRLRNLENAI